MSGTVSKRGIEMSLNTKVRLLQAMNHILSLYGIWYIIQTRDYSLFGVSLALAYLFGGFGTTIALHRYFTHRSFETYKPVEWFMYLISTLATVGPSISWVALHRMHHHNSDQASDPHSPLINGKFNATQAVKVFFGYDWNIQSIPVNYVKDLMRKKPHRFIFNNYFKIIFAYVILLALLNPLYVVWFYSLPVTITVIFIGMVNVFSHSHGYRNYETNDHSTNSWIVNLITLGEGWHNNHHAKPNRSYVGEMWWEIDIMGLVIEVIKKR